MDAPLAKPNWNDRKFNLRQLIIKTFVETGHYVEYSFLMQTLEPSYLVLVSLLKGIALDDYKLGRPTADSLVARRGQAMPSIEHFDFRVRSRIMLSIGDAVMYHTHIMQKWCVMLNVDPTTLVNGEPRPKNKVRQRYLTDRSAAVRKPGCHVSDDTRRIINGEAGSFSYRELIKRQK